MSLTIDPRIIATHDQHLAITRDHLANLDADDLQAVLSQWSQWIAHPDLGILAAFATLGLTTAYLSAVEPSP